MAEAQDFGLQRFVAAQDEVMAQVLRELQAGQKRSHWMWFVFPQLAGLGHSAMARHYAIASKAEALAYLAHPVLGPRLMQCTKLVNAAAGRNANAIFGSPDDLKFCSSMTLFNAVAPGRTEFSEALAKYFAGKPDLVTIDKLAAS